MEKYAILTKDVSSPWQGRAAEFCLIPVWHVAWHEHVRR